MWFFCRAGVFSAVMKGKRDEVVVRARVRADLKRLRKEYDGSNEVPGMGPIVETPKQDYPFRASFTRAAFAWLLFHVAHGVDYPNFKSMVLQEQGAERERVYHEVWATLMKLQAPRAQRALPLPKKKI